MSGSPIIQNDRLVGAVTHVFVNNPTKGYGIFAEWMVEKGNKKYLKSFPQESSIYYNFLVDDLPILSN